MLLVAECGSMHEGNVHLACEMIRLAKEAGCDIAKFQFGHPADDPVRHVSEEFASLLKQYADYAGIELMASIFSHQGLDLARKLKLPRYKIAYQMKDCEDFIREVISDGKITYISGTTIYREENVRPIFVVSQYPTYPWDQRMPPWFSRAGWYGYSDHSHGIAACLIAAAKGAQYIEKHFTLNKASQSVRDNAFSASPDEMAEMVRNAREIHNLVGAA